MKHYQTFEIFEKEIDHIDNVDDMEHNDEPFSPPHGKCSKWTLLNLPRRYLVN